jgi:hypothetical protein
LTGMSISTTSLPAGAVGTAYLGQIEASGGAPPYTWSVTAGSLIAGELHLHAGGKGLQPDTASRNPGTDPRHYCHRAASHHHICAYKCDTELKLQRHSSSHRGRGAADVEPGKRLSAHGSFARQFRSHHWRPHRPWEFHFRRAGRRLVPRRAGRTGNGASAA